MTVPNPHEAPPSAQGATSTSGDIPDSMVVRKLDRGFDLRIEMIPMRDGIRLKTYICIPRADKPAPVLLLRTPYDAALMVPRMSADKLLAEGYIRVFQDVRGKFGSEGEYVVTRPLRGLMNRSGTDHATDAWDTIDWLVNNLAASNGKVGVCGNSYAGFTASMALIDPHPALRAAAPTGPLIDAWMGDDWFHHGAFRQLMLGYIHQQTAQKGAGVVTPSEYVDQYEAFLRAGSAGQYIRQHRLDELPFVSRLIAHPAYDDYWQSMAVDRQLAARPSMVPTLWIQGLWDQEDLWGANHAWRALGAAGYKATNWLVMGPWNHNQVWQTAPSLGPLNWHADTAHQFFQDVLLPFLNEHLRDGRPANLAPVTVYNTGDKRWERLPDWPASEAPESHSSPLFLTEAFSLSFERPSCEAGSDTYISDPAKPVPFLPRPVWDPFEDYTASGVLGHSYEGWSKWLVHDQRFVDGRPDVLTYESPVLSAPLHVQGVPLADLHAMTSGTDGDFVVKLIDVYPARDPREPGNSGYQLPIAMDIFRGRYRESFEQPSAIPADTPQRYRFQLPNVNHVFKAGHRIMVQIQSTWFPLYDRNPQTYVANIFNACPEDYRPARVTVMRSMRHCSAIWLPIVGPRREQSTPQVSL